MQSPPHGAGSGGREGSDLFSVPGRSESLIPELREVPETPEEKRRRRTVRIIVALVTIVVLTVAVLVTLFLLHMSAVENAALAVGADARPALVDDALDVLEGDDSAEDLALRARIHATAALEHGSEEHAQAARDLLERLGDDETAQKLTARVAKTYLALAAGNPREAASYPGTAFAGTYAAEGAHAAALAGLAVGDVTHALETSEIALQKGPGAPRYAALHAIALARNGRDADALGVLDGLSEEAKSSPGVQLARARILLRSRSDLAAARAAAEAVIGSDAAAPTEKAWAQAIVARIEALEKRPGAAREALEQAMQARPPGDEAFALVALDTWLDLKAWQQAEELSSSLPEGVSTDPGVRAQLAARLALARNQLDAAEAALRTAPDEPRTTLLRARLSDARGNHDEARTQYASIASNEHWGVEAQWRLGAMELALGRPDEALAAATAALEREATDPDAVAVAARAHVAKEEPQRGMQLVERALAAHANDPRLLAAKAVVQMATESWSDALTTLRTAVEREPRSAELWAQLGDAARRTGETDEAKGAYERAVELEPREPMALVGLFQLAVDAEDVERARTALEAVAAAEIENAALDRPRARFYVLSGAGTEGIPDVRRALVRRAPNDPVLWRDLGWLQYQAEVFDQAARSFARAQNELGEGQTDLETRLGLALSQIALRSTAPAENTLENAQEDAGTGEHSPFVRALHLAVRARYQFAEDRAGPARALANQALRLDEDNWVAHEVIADVIDDREGDPTENLQAAANAVPPSVSAKGRLALRAEELTDPVCEWANQYRAATLRGRYDRRTAQIVADCRRR